MAKDLNLTPTPTGYANMLWAVATESTNAGDRAWAKMSLIDGYAESAHNFRKESQAHQETLAAEIVRLNGLLSHINELAYEYNEDFSPRGNAILSAISFTTAGEMTLAAEMESQAHQETEVIQ